MTIGQIAQNRPEHLQILKMFEQYRQNRSRYSQIGRCLWPTNRMTVIWKPGEELEFPLINAVLPSGRQASSGFPPKHLQILKMFRRIHCRSELFWAVSGNQMLKGSSNKIPKDYGRAAKSPRLCMAIKSRNAAGAKTSTASPHW